MKTAIFRSALAAGIILLSFAFIPVPVLAEQCYSACKEGPKEYSSGVTWQCIYDQAGNYNGFGNVQYDDFTKATCRFAVKGKFKDIILNIGRIKSFNECLTDKCIPQVQEICGELDRCADPKNWRKW